MKFMRSLREQISLSILLVVLGTVALVSLLANLFINRQFEEYITEQEKTRSENIVSDLSGQYNGLTRSWSADYLHTIGMYSLYDGYILKVYNSEGDVVWDAENHDMSLCGQVMDDISARMGKSKNSGGFVAHSYDISQGGKKIGAVSINYYGPYFFSESDFQFISALNAVLVVISVFAFLFSIAAGWLLARRIARPISKTAEIAKQISRGNYNIRFESETKIRELKDLVSAINSLASALDEQKNLRKRLTTDVAHELRTPLTAVGSHLEAMIERIWDVTPERLQSCHEEIVRLGKLVADLGRLAEIESDNLKLHKSSVDLPEIVRAVCDAMEMEFKKKKQSLSISGRALIVEADKDRIRQVITNLLSNAVKYTPENGNISITVTDSGKSGVIKVQDDGIGIPENELPIIFERFYRTDKSRNRKTGGAGIGLAIVKSIVTAHGGTVEVSSLNGQGSCFTVALPKP